MLLVELPVNAQQVFLPNLISTDKTESSLTKSADGEELYFARSESFYKPSKKIIYYSTKENGVWTQPRIAPFSGKFSDSSPFVTYDEQHLYFCSDRPVDGQKESNNDIWRVNRQADGTWSEPEHLGFVIKSESSEYSPSLDLQGNLYFGSTRNQDEWGNIFVSKLVEGAYQKPEPLPYPVNTEDREWGSCISPDGDFIVFESYGRNENLTYDGDMFIAFKDSGQWKNYFHLPLNSTKSDLTPKIFQDAAGVFHLYFASNRNVQNLDTNDVDIYRAELTSIIAELRVSQIKK